MTFNPIYVIYIFLIHSQLFIVTAEQKSSLSTGIHYIVISKSQFKLQVRT